MLIDSNIIIYASLPEHSFLRRLIANHTPAVSAISYVEVFGYPRLTPRQRQYFEAFFLAAPVLPVDDHVLEKATELRQLKSMSLGDSLIAGTALVFKENLVTRNARDFAWIDGLDVTDPFSGVLPDKEP